MKLDPLEARAVLRQCDFGALATHCTKLPGYPFVSHAPFALDAACRPVLLLSNLAEHSRNLAQDARASLMATVAGPVPQEQARITLVGEIAPFAPEPALVERYLRYHPQAAAFLGFGDFRFYRLQPLRARLIGGFARAGWIEAGAWAIDPLGEASEAAILARLAASVPLGWQVLGVDREGIDARDAQGERLRLEWPGRAEDEQALLACAREALERAQRP